jgi:adenylate kinase family enzyme
MAAMRGGDCVGRKLLILGDVNTGKTTLARGLLDDLCRRSLGAHRHRRLRAAIWRGAREGLVVSAAFVASGSGAPSPTGSLRRG